MDGDHNSRSEGLRTLEVTHREGLALLSALELAPFDDEVLIQKLLNLVYSRQETRHTRPRRRLSDVTHRRR